MLTPKDQTKKKSLVNSRQIAVFLALLLTASVAFAKPDLFLLKTYKDQAIVGWVMSEKLDGVRGFWDGKQLLTRSGKRLNPPDWFTADYPPFAIDGELWTKRGNFEQIVSIVRRKLPDQRWHNISHQIFEVPNQAGGLLDRLAVLETYLANHPHTPIKIIKQTTVVSQTQAQRYLQQIVDGGGEGVVIRNPATPYRTGRLSDAVKLKQYLDSECVVTKILAGKGKYTNKMGAVECRTPAGTYIKIGSGFTDNDRQTPPAIGSQITYKYYGYTRNGIPKFPVYLRKANNRGI